MPIPGKSSIAGSAESVVNQNGGAPVKQWVGTQSQYDAIGSKDSATEYIITDAASGGGFTQPQILTRSFVRC